MKIAIIGSHSTGKTTLAKEMVKIYKNHFLISEVARIYGIEKINPEKRTLQTQKDMLQTQMNIEKYHENFISDRSVLDFGMYSGNEFFMLQTRFLMQNRYDFVFYLPIAFKLVDDGFRNVDETYQKEIDRLFQVWMPTNVIKISSMSIEDRIYEIIDYLEDKY